MLGKAGTMVYAVLGIPLMLVYLSSVGSLLSRCVRGALSRAFCCCLCANCGYCCYDEKRMQERERRLKKKRQQLEIQQQQQQHQQQMQLQEPFYVRDGVSASASSTHNNCTSPARDGDLLKLPSDPEYGAGGGDGAAGAARAAGGRGPPTQVPGAARGAVPRAHAAVVCLGAAALVKLEKWTFSRGCYFCFMSLSTIGFGDLVPAAGRQDPQHLLEREQRDGLVLLGVHPDGYGA
ncbi:Uncharacterized protein GBIM_07771 [Gryllus bimaculatus]|nr:Uncharacterized protein GBIM_07771 [Gryllus bimaculatus]